MSRDKHDEGFITPVSYADRAGRLYADSSSIEHKKNYGQYLTPIPVARLMAKFFKAGGKKEVLRVLDPGAGSGVLGCAVIEHIANQTHSIKRIELIAYESDKGLQPILDDSLKYATEWLKQRRITLNYEIRTGDFVLENAACLGEQLSFEDRLQHFDLIISNPPYFKLSKDDPRARAASYIVHGQPNIYAVFMAISAYLLKRGGGLIFIVPRSFAAGPYFRLFRERFFSKVRPEYIHLFGSRKDAFNRDEVLQEHVILAAKRHDAWYLERNRSYQVMVSSSRGIADITHLKKRKTPLAEIINMNEPNKYMFIPATDGEQKIIHLVNSWDGNLHRYGMEISTGPVVPFRAERFIHDKNGSPGKVPLLWMQNVKAMTIAYPLPMRKSQYIVANPESGHLLLPNKNYVLLRRFSAKEEQRRLTAAPFVSSEFKFYDVIGFENHVNYIYRPKGQLSLDEIYGLAAILNCHIIDTYFRTYNGNTQVSATELRGTPLPPLDLIIQIGRKVRGANMKAEHADVYVAALLMRGEGFEKTQRSARNS